MPENRSRFVLLCQHTLALGLVAAIAAPAANLVSLDIVAPPSPAAAGGAATAAPEEGAAAGGAPAPVASAPVRPRVTDVSLGGVTRAGLDAMGSQGSQGGAAGGAAALLVSADTGPQDGDLAVLSDPEPVENLATVGVTWAHGEHVGE